MFTSTRKENALHIPQIKLQSTAELFVRWAKDIICEYEWLINKTDSFARTAVSKKNLFSSIAAIEPGQR